MILIDLPPSIPIRTWVRNMVNNNTARKESEILFTVVRDRYGNLFDPEQLGEVRKGIEDIVKVAEVLRSIKLKNSDEPFFVFKPYRKE